jgi:hypothetical protein
MIIMTQDNRASNSCLTHKIIRRNFSSKLTSEPLKAAAMEARHMARHGVAGVLNGKVGLK